MLYQKLEKARTSSNGTRKTMDELKTRWKMLWRERIDDKIRAEGIAKQDYSKLFVARGLVVIATRNYKPMDFVEGGSRWHTFGKYKPIARTRARIKAPEQLTPTISEETLIRAKEMGIFRSDFDIKKILEL